MADSGYESFNTFAHLIRKGMYFVIRMKDINSNGILSAYDLPDSKFDTHIRTTLTKRHTKETLGNPNTYTILQPSTDFDFLDENCMYYDIEFRIVRVRLDNGTYICIATNLSEEFPLEEIEYVSMLCEEMFSLDDEYENIQIGVNSINEDEMILMESIESLDPLSSLVLKYRYKEDMTQSEVAKVLGISQVKVSRLESKGKQELLEYIS